MDANTGAWPFTSTSPVGKVRLLVGDTDPERIADGDTGTYLWYSDDEITSLLEMFGGSVARTAAHITRAVGRDEALLLKKFSSADLTVDGPAIARSMFAAAAELDKMAERDDEIANASGTFALVPTGGVSIMSERIRESEAGAADVERIRALMPWMV